MSYLELSDDAQVEVLRPVALRAAEEFGLQLQSMELAAHAYNTTFRAETGDGGCFALRVGTNSQSTPEHVVAQQAWQRAIAAETDVRVPEPLATRSGAWFAEVACGEFGRPLLVTAARWLPGVDAEQPDARVARELGRTMALLHRQAEHWSPPAGGSMPRLDEPLFGDEDLLRDSPSLEAHADVLARAREKTERAFTAVYADQAVRALHADLHGGNLKWDEGSGRLAVFDFDDCGLGVPVLDLAISTFYLRGGDPAAERALWSGYADVAPPPDVDPAHVEALMAARQLLLANSVLASTTAELRGEAAAYLDVTVSRLDHWLRTGTFTRTIS